MAKDINHMLNRERYWKCEYENRRRKKARESDKKQRFLLAFMDKTWKLLHELGMSDEEILTYYKGELNDTY